MWIGITLAILFLSGKTPSSNEELQISLKTVDIVLPINLRHLVGIDVGPEDLVSSRVPMMPLISSGVVGVSLQLWASFNITE